MRFSHNAFPTSPDIQDAPYEGLSKGEYITIEIMKALVSTGKYDPYDDHSVYDLVTNTRDLLKASRLVFESPEFEALDNS